MWSYDVGIFESEYGGYDVAQYCEDDYIVMATFETYEEAEEWMAWKGW